MELSFKSTFSRYALPWKSEMSSTTNSPQQKATQLFLCIIMYHPQTSKLTRKQSLSDDRYRWCSHIQLLAHWPIYARPPSQLILLTASYRDMQNLCTPLSSSSLIQVQCVHGKWSRAAKGNNGRTAQKPNKQGSLRWPPRRCCAAAEEDQRPVRLRLRHLGLHDLHPPRLRYIYIYIFFIWYNYRCMLDT